MRNSRRLLVSGFAALLLLTAAGLKIWDDSPPGSARAPDIVLQSNPPQESSGRWDNLLPSMIQAGNLPDLRWPDFGNYRVDLTNFYESSRFELAWVKEGRITPQARGVIEAFRNAEGRGLNAEDYDNPRWADRVAMLQGTNPAPTAVDFARFDLALTVSLMRFISDLHIGRINPRYLHSGFNIGPAKYDLAHFVLHRIVDAQDVDAGLDAAEPPFPSYRLARRALATYIRLAREDSGEPLPVPDAAVRRGESYPGVERLAHQLRLVGDLPPDAVVPAGATVYTSVLEEAVKRFQRRHGLDPDGRLGKATLGQLNTPLSFRVRQLLLTMERWRWVPHEFSHPPIIVNIPEFQLRAFDEEGNVALAMKVVVGKAFQSETPVFAKDMRYIIFRPYWNVPPSIQRRELVPQIRKNRDYLVKNGYEVTDSRGEVVSDGTVSDEILEGLRRGALTVRQRPGPKNSLGLVKFMFPNEFDVYLHGTPATELFSRSRRDFSHGCIRVEDPERLAVWALDEKPAWTEASIRAAIQGTETIQVNLDNPIPVLVFYTTAVVTEDGTVKFLQDIYRYDAAMEQLLAKGYPYTGQE
jgi:murein L,D-transpeptidase YcbB/YkuD